MNKKPRVNLRFDEFPTYKGGTTMVSGGYIHEFCPGHRLQNQWGWVLQHRLVIEDKIGRPLRRSEVAHHVDHVRTNNHPDNLQVMTRRAHQIHHMRLNSEKLKIPLDAEEVRQALQKTGGIKPAARLLNCCHSTLRKRFPELTAKYQRRSPTRIDDPKAIALVLKYAPDPKIGLREVVAATGMAAMTAWRIAARHGIPWVKKSRKGEKRRTYRGQPVKRDGQQTEPALPRRIRPLWQRPEYVEKYW